MSKKTTPRVLKYAGLLGHAFCLIERSDHETAVDDWICRAEANSLESAESSVAMDRDWQIWERLLMLPSGSEKWRLVKEGISG